MVSEHRGGVKMKRFVLSLMILLVFVLGCTVGVNYVSKATREDQDRIFNEKEKRLSNLKQEIVMRGYISIEELQETFDSLKQWRSAATGIGHYRYSTAAKEVLSTAIECNLLPFQATFYLALEKESYDEAEVIKRTGIYWLRKLAEEFKFNDPLAIKIDVQIQKFTSIVGLTDPILVKLRKELVITLNDKKWDEAQKIQNVIGGRVRELTSSPQPQTIERVVGSGSQTTFVVQQPSHIQVERIPRYGISDYGRVLGIIGGKPMNSKDEATLKLFDMLMGR
jgi:hypothetical protein